MYTASMVINGKAEKIEFSEKPAIGFQFVFSLNGVTQFAPTVLNISTEENDLTVSCSNKTFILNNVEECKK